MPAAILVGSVAVLMYCSGSGGGGGTTTTYGITGTVTLNGSGLSGVTVTLSGDASATTTSDTNGQYSFTGLANGNYIVTPSANGETFTPTALTETISNANLTGQNFAATAFPTYGISGTVTLNGSGLTGVLMTLNGASAATGTTDSNGNYSFSGLLNGTYTVTASQPYYSFTPTSLSVMISNASMTGQNFTATALPTFTLSGTVTLNSSGLSGVNITLSGTIASAATSDANGNYSFSVVNGSYTITPSRTSYVFTPASLTPTINNADITNQNFSAAPTYSISGTVTYNGSGQQGVSMMLSGAASATGMTNASGNYSFSGLLNGGYTVTPSPVSSSYTYTPANSPETVSNANITGVNFTATSTVQPVACPGGGTTNVSIVDFSFNPSSVTISANGIVKWTNTTASTTHTVTSTTVPAGGGFDSGDVNPGTSVCFQFTQTGTYNYHCSIHTFMTGTVTVQ